MRDSFSGALGPQTIGTVKLTRASPLGSFITHTD